MADSKSTAVLLDALCAAYGYTRVEAEEAERYARNLGAVRALTKHTPGDDGDEGICPECTAEHGRWSHYQDCPIAAAWRALGDPRGAADIEIAHEQALGEEINRSRREALRAQRGEWPEIWAQAGRDAVAAIRRQQTSALPALGYRTFNFDTPQGLVEASRRESDARGMEAVEAEARYIRSWGADWDHRSVAIVNVGEERETMLLVPNPIERFRRTDSADHSTLYCPCGSSVTFAMLTEEHPGWLAEHVPHLPALP